MMRVLLVDDEQPALEEMEYLLHQYAAVEIVGMIQDGREVLKQVNQQKPDAVFLDIDMPGANGLELALKIQELHAGIVIVFVTAYSEYALDAFRAYPLDYILKPVKKKRLDSTMQHLIEQVEKLRPDCHLQTKARIRCFGNFDVYTEDDEKRQIKFTTRKMKEMFAYLVSNFGRQVSRQELLQNIFSGNEDKKTINLLHVTAYKLRHALESIGIDREDVIISGNYCMQTAEGVCDYIDFVNFTQNNSLIDQQNLADAERIAELYKGAFLENEEYLWAEEIRTETELKLENLLIGIANYCFETCRAHQGEKALVKLLHFDPLSETGNHALLDFYMKSGNTLKFREHYKKYEALMKEEFHLAPERQYIKFFAESV